MRGKRIIVVGVLNIAMLLPSVANTELGAEVTTSCTDISPPSCSLFADVCPPGQVCVTAGDSCQCAIPTPFGTPTALPLALPVATPATVTVIDIPYIVHASNIILLCAFIASDILWLRLLTIIAVLLVGQYLYVQGGNLTAPMGWAAAFIGINIYQVWRLYKERRPVVFTADEQRLYRLGFRSLDQHEFLELLGLGRWRDAKPDERVRRKGEPQLEVMMLLSGRVAAVSDHTTIRTISPGRIVGDGAVLTGSDSPADFTVSDPARLIMWPLAVLEDFLARRPEVRAAFHSIVATVQ